MFQHLVVFQEVQFPHFIEFQDPAVKGPVPRRDVYLFTSVPTSVVLTLASVPTSEYVTIKEGGRCSQCMDEIIQVEAVEKRQVNVQYRKALPQIHVCDRDMCTTGGTIKIP